MTDDYIYPPFETLWAHDWDDLVSLSEEAAAYDDQYWREQGEPQ